MNLTDKFKNIIYMGGIFEKAKYFLVIYVKNIDF